MESLVIPSGYQLSDVMEVGVMRIPGATNSFGCPQVQRENLGRKKGVFWRPLFILTKGTNLDSFLVWGILSKFNKVIFTAE